MKRVDTFFILLVVLFITNIGFAQSNGVNDPDELIQKLRQRMLEHQKQIQKLFEDDFFGGSAFGDDPFDDPFFKQAFGQQGSPFQRANIGKWKEDDQHKILLLNMQMDENNPLDIQIKEGKITVKADIKEEIKNVDPTTGQESISISQRRVHQSFGIPEDCDPNSAEIKKVGDHVEISFKKKSSSKSNQILRQPKKVAPQKPEENRKPIVIEGETI